MGVCSFNAHAERTDPTVQLLFPRPHHSVIGDVSCNAGTVAAQQCEACASIKGMSFLGAASLPYDQKGRVYSDNVKWYMFNNQAVTTNPYAYRLCPKADTKAYVGLSAQKSDRGAASCRYFDSSRV